MGKAGAHAGVSKRTKFTRPSAGGGGGRTAFAPSQRHTNVQPRAAIPDEYVSAQKATITTTTISKTFSSWEGGNNNNNHNNNDSDKENWSPDEDGNPRSFRTTAPSSSGRHPLPSAARSMAAKLDGNTSTSKNPRRTTALQQQEPRRVGSLQRGSTAPGSWSSYAARRRQGGGGRPSLQGRSQSALEIYEDGDGASEEEDDDGEDREDAACERLLEMCGGVGGVSPSKEKAVAAATGLLSLKWGR
jgi:hypothetical protein